MNTPPPAKICAISGATLTAENQIPCSALRPSLLRFIQRKHPKAGHGDFISRDMLPALDAAYVENALSEEAGEITDLERAVIESMKEQEILSAHPDDNEALAARTFGERLADRIASFGGSWRSCQCRH